jgi:hypothetical protein
MSAREDLLELVKDIVTLKETTYDAADPDALARDVAQALRSVHNCLENLHRRLDKAEGRES